MEEEKKYEDQAKQQEEDVKENQETTNSFDCVRIRSMK